VPEGYKKAEHYISGGQAAGCTDLLATYFVGQPEIVAQFYELVPSPNETYCNLFWLINTEAVDKLVRERKAKHDERRRRRALRRRRP
jgi:hypothetical protein